MTSSLSAVDKNNSFSSTKSALTISELRSRVLIGLLPDDFLRLTQSTSDFQFQNNIPQQQVQSSEQSHVLMPIDLANPTQNYTFVPAHTRGRLTIKIAEAKLTKNYGFVRMDPYVRIRVGQAVFETPTSVNGGKMPSWNRVVNAYLPNGVESIYIQIYDERAFTNDECVAWVHLILPDGIFSNEVIDEWYSLSGPQGDEKEGVINLVMSFVPINIPQSSIQNENEQTQIPQQINDSNTPQIQEELITEEELTELSVIFPTIEKDVIRSVLEEKRGNKDATVTALIEITN